MSSPRMICGLVLALSASLERPALADSYTLSAPEFTVVFPATPRHSTKKMDAELGAVLAQEHGLRVTDVVLFIMYWDFPSLPEDPKRVLDRVGELTVKPSRGPNEPMGESDITITGFPGREYRFGREGVIRMIQRTYLVRSRMYILIVISDYDAPIDKSATAQAFLKSFAPKAPK